MDVANGKTIARVLIGKGLMPLASMATRA